ncbi:MAG: HAD family phosphatase [Clostridia bacterium]|nr:HAD family phosphatase [Clostridia bacterium]
MKAIIFDMDGLMIDTERLYFETQREIAQSYGKKLNHETLWKMMGRKPIESIMIFVDDLKIDIEPAKMLEIRDRIFEDKLRKDLRPMPGLFKILEEFEGKMKLAIATGAPKIFLDIVMEKLDIRHYFDVIQTSDTIKNGKPDPEIYLEAIKKLGVEPEECFVLEDSSNGALAGKRAGCYTIAVPSEYTIRQEFGFVNYIARGLNDAREHIKMVVSRTY